jgi:small basic protein (TIGR04137 family)
MSLDASLKTGGGLSRHRNVLTRAERLAKLQDAESWEESKSVFGLPKVANRNVKVGKKAKKKEEATAEGAEAAPAAAAPAAKAGAKAAAKPAAKPGAKAK